MGFFGIRPFAERVEGILRNGKAQPKASDLAKNSIANRSYLPDVGDRGLTTYAKDVLGLPTVNAEALAGDLRGAGGSGGIQAAGGFLDGFKPVSIAERVNAKAGTQALVDAEIAAVKRELGVTDTDEAIAIANNNRLNNESYEDGLLANSGYARERINQGDVSIAEQYAVLADGIQKREIDPNELNPRGQGIMRGGIQYMHNPAEPNRMAGDRVEDLIGVGTFADVYRDPEMPGVVRKEQPAVVQAVPFAGPQLFANKAVREAHAQLAAAEKGIGPRVDYLERNPDGSTVIGMQDVSENYRTLAEAAKDLTPEQLAGVLVKHNIQLAELGNTPLTVEGVNVRGMAMADRHKDNVMVHKMNNRPIQLDFGMESSSPGGGFQGTSMFVDSKSQATLIGEKASKALIAAGLSDEGKIVNDSVQMRLRDKDYDGALEAAMAGLDIAKRIKGPVKSTNVLSPATFRQLDGSISTATTDNLLGTEGIYSRFSQ